MKSSVENLEQAAVAQQCGVVGGRKPRHLLQVEAKPFCKNLLRRFPGEASTHGFLRIANYSADIPENL